MRKKITIVIGLCILLSISFFSGCVNVPKELTQFSIISFDVEPGIINQGESANLSWAVISAASVSIDNGIGTVALTGHRIIQPTQTTTYTLTASNTTTARNATVTITVKNADNTSGDGGYTKAPDMVFNKEISPIKGIRLVRSNLGLLWEDFTIIGGIPPTGAVTAGQFIQLSGATGTITIVHKATNTLIGTWTWV